MRDWAVPSGAARAASAAPHDEQCRGWYNSEIPNAMLQMRLIWHFLKRILRYDVVFSAAGAGLTFLLTLLQQSDTASGNPPGILIQIGVRFVVIAGTAGYALSVWIYLIFYRYELPVYLNGGLYIEKVIFASYGFLAAGLSVLTAVPFVLKSILNI